MSVHILLIASHPPDRHKQVIWDTRATHIAAAGAVLIIFTSAITATLHAYRHKTACTLCYVSHMMLQATQEAAVVEVAVAVAMATTAVALAATAVAVAVVAVATMVATLMAMQSACLC